MANFTEKLKLKKPLKSEFYNVDDFNGNADKIDEAFNEFETNLTGKLDKGGYTGTAQKLEELIIETTTNLNKKIETKEPLISKKSGFNLEKTDIAEDDTNKLATAKCVYNVEKNINALIIANSGLEYNKDLLYLNDAGTKEKGKFYLDRYKNGLFECLENTETTLNNTQYFKNISNLSNSKTSGSIGEWKVLISETWTKTKKQIEVPDRATELLFYTEVTDNPHVSNQTIKSTIVATIDLLKKGAKIRVQDDESSYRDYLDFKYNNVTKNLDVIYDNYDCYLSIYWR